MNEINLLPCPFCGGKAYIRCITAFESHGFQMLKQVPKEYLRSALEKLIAVSFVTRVIRPADFARKNTGPRRWSNERG